MASSIGKRRREQQKLEQAQAKAERKAARQATGAKPAVVLSHQSEAELIEALEALHRALEDGEVSPEEFEEGRDRIQAQFERLWR